MDNGSWRWRVPRRPRSRPRLGSALALLCVASSACSSGGSSGVAGGTRTSTAPITFGVAGSRDIRVDVSVRDSVITAPLSSVWFVMPSVFETLNVETETLDVATMVIGHSGLRVQDIGGRRPSTYLDCGGGGPNADRFEVTLQLVVQLAGRPDGGTLVRTVVDAYARPRDVSGNSFHCTSKGALERRVMGLIMDELAALATESAEANAIPPGAALPGDERSSAAYVLFADNLRFAREAFAPTSRVRLPVSGDLLRVECFSPQDPEGRIDETRFVRMTSGALVTRIGDGSRDVVVPVSNLGSIEVLDRRSRTQWGGITGGLLGAVAGGFLGASVYDRDAKLHFGQGVYVAGGAVLVGIVGAVIGRSIGSAFSAEAWVDPPRDWVVRYLGPTSAPSATSAPVGACPSFAADGF